MSPQLLLKTRRQNDKQHEGGFLTDDQALLNQVHLPLRPHAHFELPMQQPGEFDATVRVRRNLRAGLYF